MNIQEYDLMNCIMEQDYVNQRILSEITGYSLGKVNSSLKKLTELGYLDEKMQCTPRVYEELEEKKPGKCNYSCSGIWNENGSYQCGSSKRDFRGERRAVD